MGMNADAHESFASQRIILSAKKLNKTYRMGEVLVNALQDVNLELTAGEFVVLLGPSGSGKSTLLNILGGLDTATSGEVVYRDHDLMRSNDQQLTEYRRDHVGFVFQFYNLIPSLTAIENIALVTDIARAPISPAQALSLVGLSDRARHFPSQLSAGEQQRVAVARAVAKRPDILLCDEPTGALDLATGKLVLETLLSINKEIGTLVVIITHNSSIAGIADRVIRLQDGKIKSIEKITNRMTLQEVQW
jgi:putative ABC transport system ATP-binding protein